MIEKVSHMRYDVNPNKRVGASRMASVHYISVNREVMGGAPVITGTRIPAERIGELLKQGYTEESLKKEFGGISIKKLRGAMYELTLLGLEKLDELELEPHPA